MAAKPDCTTALHEAVARGYTKIVDVLLQYGKPSTIPVAVGRRFCCGKPHASGHEGAIFVLRDQKWVTRKTNIDRLISTLCLLLNGLIWFRCCVSCFSCFPLPLSPLWLCVHACEAMCGCACMCMCVSARACTHHRLLCACITNIIKLKTVGLLSTLLICSTHTWVEKVGRC